MILTSLKGKKMFDKLIYASVVFMGFLAIMNPIASISIFLSLTRRDTEEEVKKIAFQSTLTALLIVVIFSLAGYYLLKFFGVTFTALRLTGGILVAIIGYEMLQEKQSTSYAHSKENIEKEETEEDTEEEEGSIAITPLGIPLLAGPGVIITAMNFSAGGIINCIATIIAFALLCTITYFVFIFGKQIKKMVGTNILKVMTRMMGLILAVIGIQMLLEGIYSAVNEFHYINYF